MNNFTETVQTKSDEDLLEMVYEFDQWNPEMLEAVERELSKRKILPGDLAAEKQSKVEAEKSELLKGKAASLAGQVIGWLTVFGFLGVAIGYNYAFSKVKSKYSATQYFKYDDKSRKMGRNLFYCSSILTSTAVLYKIVTMAGTNI